MEPLRSVSGRLPASNRSPQVGIFLPMCNNFGLPGDPTFAEIRDLVIAAEELGLDSIWSGDHFIELETGHPDATGWWEMWTFLSAFAALTQRITIGSYVNCVLFRNPGVLAKQAEALDEISQGRFVLGLGAGWNKEDFARFGLLFDNRIGRFSEGLDIISSLLRTGEADFSGRYYQANQARNIPRGPSAERGGVPILIGGKGPRTLDLAARYADMWDSDFVSGAEALAPVLHRVDEACEAAGREPVTLARSTAIYCLFPGHYREWSISLEGSAARIAEELLAFRELGVRQVVIGFDPATRSSLETIARAIELAG